MRSKAPWAGELTYERLLVNKGPDGIDVTEPMRKEIEHLRGIFADHRDEPEADCASGTQALCERCPEKPPASAGGVVTGRMMARRC